MGQLTDTISSPSSLESLVPETVIEGIIGTGADAITDEVWVLINEFDEGVHKHGPVIWNPTIGPEGLYLPNKDDKCIILRSHKAATLWMPTWSLSGNPFKTWSELLE